MSQSIETPTVAADADSVRWNTGATTTAIQIAVEVEHILLQLIK
ncbi:MAG: hypothetical protein R2807_04400 [Chitinophagales bacterium]